MRVANWFIVTILLSVSSMIFAQDCSSLFLEALDVVDNLCDATSRNESCYGNNNIDSTPFETASEFIFEAPGDITSVSNIQSLAFSPYSLESNQWGIAVMRLQANLPETLPGQNVTVIMFGDVTINNQVEPISEVSLIATAGVNVRSRPTTNSDNVVASLANGQDVTATGILDDGTWTRISFLYNEETQINGWVATDFLSGDLSELNVISAEEALYTPMQSFYLSTGIGNTTCNDVPDDGLLIQSPELSGRVQLTINGVDISLGSTIYVRAIPDDFMYIYTIEGFVSVRADGITQLVPAGSVTLIPLDENGIATSSPQFPVPYDFEFVSRVDPILGIMPEIVTVPEALESAEIETVVDTTTNNDSASSSGAFSDFTIGTRVVVSGSNIIGVFFTTTPCSLSDAGIDAGSAPVGTGGVVLEPPVDCDGYSTARFQMDNGVLGWTNPESFSVTN